MKIYSNLINCIRTPRIFIGLGVSTFLLFKSWNKYMILPTHQTWLGYYDLLLSTIIIAVFFIAVSNNVKSKITILLIFFLLTPLIFDSLYTVYSLVYNFLLIFIINLNLPLLDLKIIPTGLLIVSAFLISWIRYPKLVSSIFGICMHTFGILFVILNIQVLFQIRILNHEKNTNSSVRQSRETTVIIIFDELGSDEIIKNRNILSTFDQLKQSSIIDAEVYPSSVRTARAIPRLLTSTAFPLIATTSKTLVGNEDHLQGLDDVPNLFSYLSNRDLKFSIHGWAIPYCAIFGNHTSDIYDDTVFSQPKSLGDSFKILFYDNNMINHFIGSNQNRNKEFYIEFKEHLMGHIESQQYDVIYAHIPLPHIPRRDGKVSEGGEKDYLVNLKECNSLLGQILNALSRYDQSISWNLVVTSDHWRRASNIETIPHKVPFIYTNRMNNGMTIKIDEGGNNIALFKIIKTILTIPATNKRSKIILDQLLESSKEKTDMSNL